MALENFDGAREYLARHQVHRLFEDCIEDLVVSRPTDKEGITKCIVSRVDGVLEKKKTPTTRQYVLCLGLPGSGMEDALEAALRGSTNAGHVPAPVPGGNSSTDVQKAISHIHASGREISFITGFPATLAQAMTLEAIAGSIKQAVVFIDSTTHDATSHMPKDGDSEAYAKYLELVHPTATYYQALGKLTVCYLNQKSGEMCPAAVVSKLTQ